MSTQETLFVRTGASIGAEAELFARLLELAPMTDDGGDDGTDLGLYQDRERGYLGLRLHPNAYTDPGEAEAVDGYDLAVDIWLSSKDLPAQAEAAREVFDRLVELRPDVPLLLTREAEVLLAGYLPGAGVHDFPPGTTVGTTDRHRWGAWVSPADRPAPAPDA